MYHSTLPAKWSLRAGNRERHGHNGRTQDGDREWELAMVLNWGGGEMDGAARVKGDAKQLR
jgi:hypothetical protein